MFINEILFLIKYVTYYRPCTSQYLREYFQLESN